MSDVPRRPPPSQDERLATLLRGNLGGQSRHVKPVPARPGRAVPRTVTPTAGRGFLPIATVHFRGTLALTTSATLNLRTATVVASEGDQSWYSRPSGVYDGAVVLADEGLYVDEGHISVAVTTPALAASVSFLETLSGSFFPQHGGAIVPAPVFDGRQYAAWSHVIGAGPDSSVHVVHDARFAPNAGTPTTVTFDIVISKIG